MSLEAEIAELRGTVTALTEVLKQQIAVTERVVAGQAAAIEKLEAAKPSSAGTRTRKQKEEPAAAADEGKSNDAPADTASGAAAASSASETKSFLPDVKDADGLKAHVGAWTGATEDADERAKRVGVLKAMAEHFGCAPKFAELAADADRLKQSLFFIERAKAGLPIDFKADYDFGGDPKQDGGASEVAAEEDEFA